MRSVRKPVPGRHSSGTFHEGPVQLDANGFSSARMQSRKYKSAVARAEIINDVVRGQVGELTKSFNVVGVGGDEAYEGTRDVLHFCGVVLKVPGIRFICGERQCNR